MPGSKRLFPILALVAGLAAAPPALADPWAKPGDLVLRHDIQLLADAGILSAPVTTWPIPWAALAGDLEEGAGLESAPPEVVTAARRVRARMGRVQRARGLQPNAKIAMRTSDFWLRTFEDTPREEGEVRAGASWMGEQFAARLQASYVPDPLPNDQEWRVDGSYVAVALGNHILSAGAVDRWWGPGWDNGLIFSSNPRPVAGFTLERAQALPFESKWLSWIGPWSYALHWGFLGHDRVVPNARVLAFRLTLRPLRKLEVGLTRTGVWCGSGRPCDSEKIWKLILGKDNRGQSGITEENEPGAQRAAIDARWASPVGDRNYAFYTQWVAEDEQDGFGSNWFGQVGLETWGTVSTRWFDGSWRAHLEAADTLTYFYRGNPKYDNAYNHSVYRSGYRFEGRSIGAAVDGDSRVVTGGLTLVGTDSSSWNVLAKWARINKRGDGQGRDLAHSVAVEETERTGAQVSHRREVRLGGLNLGHVAVGAGFERLENRRTSESNSDFQGFVQWTWDLSGL